MAEKVSDYVKNDDEWHREIEKNCYGLTVVYSVTEPKHNWTEEMYL